MSAPFGPGALVHPEWAPLVAAVVALVALVVVASWARARRRAARLLGAPRVVGARRLGRDLALVAALAAIAAAALGPRLGTRVERLPGSGVDVVVLVDVSRSMDATDVPPSRLARARQLAAELLARLGPGDRAALAAFAGRGVLLTPLTSDHDALAELAVALDGDLLADRASDLEAGVTAALGAFEAASERPRVVVVLSDGEDPAGGGDAAAAELARAGVRLVAIALGQEDGAPVPDGSRGIRGFDRRGPVGALLDDRGRPVVSRRDAERLARWAEASDGLALAGDRWGAIDLAAAAAAIRRDAGRAPGEEVARRVPAVRTLPLAALAFALLWLEWTGLPGARARHRPAPATARRRAAAAAGVAALVALALGAARAEQAGEAGLPEELQAAADELGLDVGAPAPYLPEPDAVPRLEAALRARPGDPELLVELGVARAERGDRANAVHALRAAALTARDPAAAALAWYDLGVLALDERELGAARDAFLEALALAPQDSQARFNLEWTLRALAEDPPPPQAGHADQDEEPSEDESESEPPPGNPEARDEGAEAERPAPAPESSGQPPPRFAPELSEEEVERWLDEVQDAAGAALRAAAEAGEGPASRRPAAAW